MRTTGECYSCGRSFGHPSAAEALVTVDHRRSAVRHYVRLLRTGLVSAGVQAATLTTVLAVLPPNHPWAILSAIGTGFSLMFTASWFGLNVGMAGQGVRDRLRQAETEYARALENDHHPK